jgi:nicotinamide-nucleotide amidase
MLFDPEILDVARRVVETNRAAGRCITTAESCTGGLVAAAITEIPGASEVLEAAFVTYSDRSKRQLLGVSEDILATMGAVSEATAWAMARGALSRTGADVAVAISGIAGPGGGTERKPVGTVVFARAVSSADESEAEALVVADTHHFGDLGRGEIRRQAALVALRLLLP